MMPEDMYLFGGDKPWRAEGWIASDDVVRGGKSRGYLDSVAEGDSVRFHGELDISALGGAGFASRRTPDADQWDLSAFGGLRLSVAEGDGKKYTLILKDEILPRRADGREQSSVSWEYDFVGGCREASEVDVRWEEFVPTYRGLRKPDAKPLDVASIKRISIMMRSFFGEQEGPFSILLRHIAAVKFTGETA
ncbi:NADH:ubiquinone oxidoreductase intermediate-associated protein 30 [Xylaria sp. CBS 124048]|nr:NADH:ubiquinone oxidoreductase intermediate-associated protein 30 [Xylaria sp. CBS 124048]